MPNGNELKGCGSPIEQLTKGLRSTITPASERYAP